MLACIELFIAVVHPVTYLRLKGPRGVRIRNIAIICVWLLCVALVISGLLKLFNSFTTLYFCIMTLVLVVVSICCLAVLWTLKRPAPGNPIRVDQSKLRVFHAIATITAVLGVSLGGVSVCNAFKASHEQNLNDGCIPTLCAAWMSLPCSLVLPIMFLQRTGKLQCHRN